MALKQNENKVSAENNFSDFITFKGEVQVSQSIFIFFFCFIDLNKSFRFCCLGDLESIHDTQF